VTQFLCRNIVFTRNVFIGILHCRRKEDALLNFCLFFKCNWYLKIFLEVKLTYGWYWDKIRSLYQILPIFFPNITFHFFTTIKLIYTFVYQSLYSYFFYVIWNMNLSNCEKSYYIQCKQSVFPRSLRLRGIFKCTNDHIFEKNMN